MHNSSESINASIEYAEIIHTVFSGYVNDVGPANEMKVFKIHTIMNIMHSENIKGIYACI